ncbi:MAG TPA: LysM peptidoglycan-binding domain-containing protein [Verrucomicrobiales bacterium]|nr:LysM peptidoglycan-binding domain-containing protein [Verrucomicrobiales bacterium]
MKRSPLLLSSAGAALFQVSLLSLAAAENAAILQKQLRDTRISVEQSRNQTDTLDAAPPPPNSGDALYTVQKGDNIWSLSRRFQVDQEAIKQANGLSGDSPVIHIGQKLRIPGKATLPGVPPEPAAAASARPAAAAEAELPPESLLGTREYVIREGDSLLGLAFRFGVPQNELQRLNQLENADAIRAGQVLRIPASAASNARPAADNHGDPAGPTQHSPAVPSEPEPDAIAQDFPVFEPNVEEAPDQEEMGAYDPAVLTKAAAIEEGVSQHDPSLEAPAKAASLDRPSPGLSPESLPDTAPRPSSYDPEIGGAEAVAPDLRVTGFGLYIVRKTDTVTGVAARHALSVAELIHLNRHLEPGSRLVPGEVLRVAPGNLLLLPEDAPVPTATGVTASIDS